MNDKKNSPKKRVTAIRRQLTTGLAWIMVFVGYLYSSFPAVADGSLSSGECQFTVSTSPGQEGVKLSRPGSPGTTIGFQTLRPLILEVLDRSGKTSWLAVNYSSILPADGTLRCQGEARTSAGTRFDFVDIYSVAKQADTFMLDRTVTVMNPCTNDTGFLSCFTLSAFQPEPLQNQEVFVPGVWYLRNQYAPPNALAAHLSDDTFLIREDRMALPLVMMRNKNNGATISLTHFDPDGSTVVADNQSARVVNAHIQVASLGIWSHDDPAVSFCYPALEGQRSYLGRQGGDRFHPVEVGVKHAYKIMISLRMEPDFPTALRQTWRAAYEQYSPPISKTNIAASYAASIKLVSDWSQIYNGCPGLPFRLQLPKGQLEGQNFVNFQMGFIGQQLPLGYQLLRCGLLHNDPTTLRKGEAMVDFWAKHSLTPEGLPRTWFDPYPKPNWRDYHTFMRVASDGMVGALMAWDVMQAHGKPKPEWLQFCRGFGDWLVKHENPDGSWYREYDFQSQPGNLAKQGTSNPIPFLVDLWKATGDKKYLDAALESGEWCFTNIHQTSAYVGGTADNSNVMDKEAGFLALNAFLALHDATGDKRWLDAAVRAADFTETWAYSRNIPMPPDDPEQTMPKNVTTTAFSLIALGHSGADLFMAAAPFLYYRVYLETGDPHYARMARQFLYNTKEAMDINGSLGYGHTGLCTEATTIAPAHGHSVNTWLPWLSWSMLNPISELQDNFQLTDLPVETSVPSPELKKADEKFAHTRGLLTQTLY